MPHMNELSLGQNSVATLTQKETLATEDGWLRELEPLTFGYEDSSLNETIEFQGLDAAGNDRKVT